MKVLVTGATGFLGSHVAEQLAAAGHEVRALVRGSSDKAFLRGLSGVELVEGSVEDAASLAKAVEGVTGIVHAAGLVKARSEEEFHRTNVDGTRNLLAAALAMPSRPRFVFVSSLAAMGPSHDGRPVPKDRAPEPVTHYGRSKLEAERAVVALKDELHTVVLRPPAIYGPRDREIFAIFQSVSRGVLPAVGHAETTLSLVYGADAAAACVSALGADVPTGSSWFIDDGEIYPFPKLLEAVETALGKKAFLRLTLPLPVVWAAAVASETFGKLTNRAVMLTRDKVNEIRQPHWVCSSVDTQEALGWRPRVSLDEGVRLTAKWYRDNGWL